MNRESDFHTDAVEPQSGSSTNILMVIWQRKGFVVLGALLGIAIGFLFHTQKSAVYESWADVLVIKKFSQPTHGANVEKGFVEDYMGTQLLIVRSQVVVEEAVNKNNLRELESFKSADPVAAIQAGLNVSRDTKDTQGAANNIMKVKFRGPVPDDCPVVINAITNAYKTFLESRYSYMVIQALEQMNRARDLVKKDLTDAQNKQLEFIKKNPFVLGSKVDIEAAAKLEQQYRDQTIKIADLKAMIDRLERAIAEGRGRAEMPLAASPGGTLKDLDMLRMRTIEEPMLSAKVKLAKDEQFLGPNHPEIKSQQMQLNVMQKMLEKIAPLGDEELAKRYREGLLTELRNANGLLVAIEEPRKEAKAKLLELAAIEAEEKNLAGDVARYRVVFDETVKTLQSMQIQADRTTEGFDASTLSRPGPGAKVAPIVYLDLGMGLVVGLLLGAGLAYLADASDKSFRGPDEIRRRLGLPLVGHIPYFKPEAELARRREAGEATIDPMLVAHLRPKSINAESYRAVRTSLFFSTQGKGHQVIQVTSPNKGDGKSLLCSNLAITIAQSGKRVLLIDADCRRPRQHKVFNVSHDVGLASVLMGQTMAHEAVQQTTIPGLDIMPCGPIPPNPSELLVSPAFKEVLEMFRQDYDFVLVDTPPVLAVTDPCVVAGKVDGLVVAIRLTRKGRPDAERAKEILTQVGANVFGIVVNGVTQTSNGVYSAQAYDYTYDYEEDDPKNHEYYTEDDEADVASAAK